MKSLLMIASFALGSIALFTGAGELSQEELAATQGAATCYEISCSSGAPSLNLNTGVASCSGGGTLSVKSYACE